MSALSPVRGTGIDELVRLARDQRGLVTRAQLIATGYDRHAIDRMLAARRLTRLSQGLFALGAFAPAGPLMPEMIASIRHDGVGVLSHLTAAMLWRITDLRSEVVHVTLVGRTSAKDVDGLDMHTCSEMHASEMRRCRGLPVTSPARTLRDCVNLVTELEFEGMLALVRKRGLARDAQIEAVIDRTPRNWPGIARFKAIFAARDSASDLRSHYERKVLALIASAELPKPLTNFMLAGHMVDFYWPDQNLVLEFDSWTFHQDRVAFETDRLRDQHLVAIGKRVQRITARQIDETPFALVARLASALVLGGPTARSAD